MGNSLRWALLVPGILLAYVIACVPVVFLGYLAAPGMNGLVAAIAKILNACIGTTAAVVAGGVGVDSV